MSFDHIGHRQPESRHRPGLDRCSAHPYEGSPRRVVHRLLHAFTEVAEEILCPSAHDRKRNSHRSGAAWSKSAVRAILANPRYTGHEVWNKQRKESQLPRRRRDRSLLHAATIAGCGGIRWNPGNPAGCRPRRQAGGIPRTRTETHLQPRRPRGYGRDEPTATCWRTVCVRRGTHALTTQIDLRKRWKLSFSSTGFHVRHRHALRHKPNEDA
ncbi:recombinase family protein [Nocardia sp. NPDC004278]